jgi:hypothetical protein
MYRIIVRKHFRVKLGMENQQVWVRDSQEGFIIGKFTDMLDGDALIVPLDPKHPQRTCPLDEVYPAGEYTKDVEDNCKFRFDNIRETTLQLTLCIC